MDAERRSNPSSFKPWITYKEERDGDFNSWLKLNKPSKLSSKDGIAWISVSSPSNDEDGENNVEAELHAKHNLSSLLVSWESLKNSNQPVTVEYISEIATIHNVLVGKWMCFPRAGPEVDSLWSKIATAVVTGSLPPSISAKVSPSKPGNPSHVLLVYNKDFTNTEEVYELEQALRQLEIKCKLLYKPDVYTCIGVYSGNEWGLRAALHESNYNAMKRGSSITSTDLKVSKKKKN